VASEYEELPLATFLEEVALVSEVDDLPEEVGAPTLLTLHAPRDWSSTWCSWPG